MESTSTIFEKILGMDDSILSVSIIDMKGQIVEYNSKYHIPISNENSETDFGIWIRAIYAMAEHCGKIFGKVQTFVSLHEKVKLMVLPMTKINFLLVLTVLPSANTEYIASRINLLITGYMRDERDSFESGSTVKTYRRK